MSRESTRCPCCQHDIIVTVDEAITTVEDIYGCYCWEWLDAQNLRGKGGEYATVLYDAAVLRLIR